MIGLLPFLSKIQSDTRVWLRTAYEHVSGSGPLQRLRVINNQSANQTSHAGMTDSSPARPSDRNVARFREFKQASEFRRSEEHTSELQSHSDLVCRLLLEKKKGAEQNSSRSNLPRSRIIAASVPAT